VKQMRMRKLRRAIAIWLLACFGMMLPAAATPVRVCFIGSHLAIAAEDAGCCHDCDRPAEGPQPCCMDLESLPDASTPEAAVLLPPVPICTIPEGPAAAPLPNHPVGECMLRAVPIRGPDSPSARRALIGVWRL
jgi:hypothetical protein